jgi:hypothetical protein
LIGDDRRQAGERDLQRLLVEDRNAEQREAEQDEVDRNADKKTGCASEASTGAAAAEDISDPSAMRLAGIIR